MARRRPGDYAQGRIYHAYFGAAAARPSRADDAVRAVFSTGGACYDCHTITPPGANGNAGWQVLPVHQQMRYMMNGWFDHDAHRTEKCDRRSETRRVGKECGRMCRYRGWRCTK